ncbi:hypothetical protein Pmani_014635 [Petrolisthes manimaculis]|uniref:Uncharacterized protein n=1 Tax=Petrolisthes manimaculis TaxID=1843537 RepID=A0AAE1UCE4_9EUCA|nr:hypothetical protein Pmani_014635 [Petrolisthes manimaculis]
MKYQRGLERGVVYKAVAEDEDLGLTCPLGPGRNTRCPCATTHYTIHHPLFRIHTTSGQVFVRTGVHLAPGGRYKALIVAANANSTGANGDIMVAWGGFPGLTDHLILNVIVQLPDTLNLLLLFPPQRGTARPITSTITTTTTINTNKTTTTTTTTNTNKTNTTETTTTNTTNTTETTTTNTILPTPTPTPTQLEVTTTFDFFTTTYHHPCKFQAVRGVCQQDRQSGPRSPPSLSFPTSPIHQEERKSQYHPPVSPAISSPVTVSHTLNA